MKIHHLNCSTFCPAGHGEDLVCHCLLIESEQGLILVDTGLGTRDIHDPEERISGLFRKVLKPPLLLQETALMQIRRMGLDPKDVRHIVVTHLDFDHAGGIDDFPNAAVHLMENEKIAARARQSFLDKRRYSKAQLSRINEWHSYQPKGENWRGFRAVRQLKGLPPEILLVPLYGHTAGHAGVAMDTGKGWLLHAGDAYFYRGEMDSDYHCPAELRAYQKLMEVDRRLRLENQQRLRKLAAETDDVLIFSAHDPVEYVSLKERELLESEQTPSIQTYANI